MQNFAYHQNYSKTSKLLTKEINEKLISLKKIANARVNPLELLNIRKNNLAQSKKL